MLIEGSKWLHHPAVDQVGWVLVHFIWQGTLVGLALAGALYLLRRHAARVRYAVSLAALVGMLGLPLATWWSLPAVEGEPPEPTAQLEGGPDLAVAQALVHRTGVGEPGEQDKPAATWKQRLGQGLEAAFPWFVIGWGGGVIVLSLRLLGGWVYTRQLRRRQVRPVGERWQARAAALAERLGIPRSADVMQSSRIDVPLVVGWWRPVVLVPVGVLTGLPPHQVEALLAHELAHVRRHDVLVGWVQAVAETLFFYHPAVWWISHQIRLEREHCCDDLAAAACQDRLTVARALTELEGIRKPWYAPVPAASGGRLLDRIRRLVEQPASPERTPHTSAAAGLVVIAVGLAVVGMTVHPTSRPERTAIMPYTALSQILKSAEEEGDATADLTSDTTAQRGRQTVYVKRDTTENVLVQVKPDSGRKPWRVMSAVRADTIRLDSLKHRIWIMGDRYLGMLDSLPTPPDPFVYFNTPVLPDSLPMPEIPPTPDLPPLPDSLPHFAFHLDSLDFDSLDTHVFSFGKGTFRMGPRVFAFNGDTLDLEGQLDSLRGRLDSLRERRVFRVLRRDSLHRTERDSIRREIMRQMQVHREEIERLRHEQREKMERLQRELRKRAREERTEHLRERAEELRRMAKELEERAREMEKELKEEQEREGGRENEGSAM